MSALREAADRIARIGRLPVPNPDRKLETEKAADAIRDRLAQGQTRRSSETWDAFLARIGLIDG